MSEDNILHTFSKIVIIYIIIILIDIPMIMNNKMYNNLFLSINNNVPISLNNNIYFSIFLAYFLISFGLYYFVIKNSTNFKQTLIEAFIFGIVLYGVYDTTNYATILKYNARVAIIDTIWGGILSMIVTGLYLKFGNKIIT
jgi:uncharacterized membrane protein